MLLKTLAEPYTVLFALLVVWITIYVMSRFLPFKKYGLEVTPLYILYKTKRFNEFLSRIAEKNRKFWRTFANIGVAAAVVEIFLAVYLLATNLHRFIWVPKEANPIIPPVSYTHLTLPTILLV